MVEGERFRTEEEIKSLALQIMKERTPSPEEVIYTPTIEFLDPENEMTREERGKVIAMGDRTAISYRNLAEKVISERDKPPVEIEGEIMDSTSAFYLQYALSARSSDEIAHTSILEQMSVGDGEVAGDSSIILEGVPILSSLKDVCSLRHFGFEAFSSRGGIFPENYWRIPRELEEEGAGDLLNTINEEVYSIYLHLTQKGLEHYIANTPKKDGEKNWQWKWRVLNLSLDDARQVTNGTFLNHLSMHPNSALSLREGVAELSASELPGTREIADKLRELAKRGLPTLMKYTDASPFMLSLAQKRRKIQEELGITGSMRRGPEKTRFISVDIDGDADVDFLSAFLAKDGKEGYEEVEKKVRALSKKERSKLISQIFEGMGLHDKPPKELEVVQINAEMTLSLGAFYEAVRHRLVTHIPGKLTPNKGYTMPEVYKDLGLVGIYQRAMMLNEKAYDLVNAIAGDDLAQNWVSRGHIISERFRISAYDAFHFLKVRASSSAHPDISRPAGELATTLQRLQAPIFDHLKLKK